MTCCTFQHYNVHVSNDSSQVRLEVALLLCTKCDVMTAGAVEWGLSSFFLSPSSPYSLYFPLPLSPPLFDHTVSPLSITLITFSSSSISNLFLFALSLPSHALSLSLLSEAVTLPFTVQP